MDPLRFAIAATPLAAYLLVVGVVNLRSRPLLVSGAGDLASMGVALTGLAFIGPISLFRPEEATNDLGNYVWLFLLALYWLSVTFVVMLGRPRLVVYNLSAEEFRPILSEAARQLDPSARWAGEAISLPGMRVQAYVDSVAWTRNTSLVAAGGDQDLQGWRRLTRALDRSLRGVGGRRSWVGIPMLAGGAGLVAIVVVRLVLNPLAVAHAWAEVFAFGTG